MAANCSYTAAGTHVAPSSREISSAGTSGGRADSSALTFASMSSSPR